jgi:hypothetical protein
MTVVSLTGQSRKSGGGRTTLQSTASEIASLVAELPTATDVNGNVCVPMDSLVSELARYFSDVAGVPSEQFINEAYLAGLDSTRQ